MLTRALAWVGLALFVYVLLTRLHTLAILASTRRGLRGAAAVRIRGSRVAVETLVVVAVLGLWATGALDRGSLDWDVGGSGVHLELAGAWFVVGAVVLTAAATLLLVITGMLAFARAVDLREQFPRRAAARPLVLRLAVMNPSVVFVTTRRSPLVWAWSEARAAAFGVLATLAIETVGHESPVAGSGLSDTVDDAAQEFELEERLAGRGRALTWSELLTLLAADAGRARAESDQLILPPAAMPVGARAVGSLVGVLASIVAGRRRTKRTAMLASIDERASIRAILERTPGPLASTYLSGSLDGLLHQVRGGVFDSLKPQLPRRHRRQLAKAYRRDGMEGAAAWMVEKAPSYPDLFHRSVHVALDRQANLVDSIVADVQRRWGR